MACLALFLKLPQYKGSDFQYLCVTGHLKLCSLNQNQTADNAVETTRLNFFDNEKFWT